MPSWQTAMLRKAEPFAQKWGQGDVGRWLLGSKHQRMKRCSLLVMSMGAETCESPRPHIPPIIPPEGCPLLRSIHTVHRATRFWNGRQSVRRRRRGSYTCECLAACVEGSQSSDA